MIDPIDNTLSYQTLEWIIHHSDYGIFALVASAPMQQKALAYYSHTDIAIYDCQAHPEEYSFGAVAQWVAEHPDAPAYFLLNFQCVVSDDDAVKQLNFSRDMLIRLEKNLVFCMTQEADDRLNRTAYDFYSYIKLTLNFQDETIDVPPSGYIDFTVTLSDQSVGEPPQINIDLQASAQQLLAAAIALRYQAKELIKQYKWRDALILSCAVLGIRERVLTPEHPDTAIVYSDIAYIYAHQGNYDIAIEFYQKALAIQKKNLGTENPYTAATYNNLAGVYIRQREYDKALLWLEKARTIREKIFGIDHPDTATAYRSIANAYAGQRNYDEALKWSGKARIIQEKTLGEHPDTALTYHNMAGIYYNQGKAGEALPWLQKALAIDETALGADHPHTIALYKNLAKVYEQLGQHDKALEWRQKANP